MRNAGFDEKIIERTQITNIEFLGQRKVRLYFRSDYFSDTGFDVSLAREEGTDRHFIEPKNTESLYGGSNWPYFSKGHWVNGILALYIMYDTIKQRTPFLQNQYIIQQNTWFKKNLEGITNAS